VYEPGLMRSMGEALRELGTERALLVHSDEGLDEISPCGATQVVRVWEGRVSTETLRPEDFGLDPLEACAIDCGETLADNVAILQESVSDAESPRARALLPSAAVAIVLGGLEDQLPAAAQRARQAIASGAARKKLEQLVEVGKGN
ncbi:MAG TPA: hypothetical protein VG820_12350, partial [Fimbriimonadaceae bacterium]|nr:hypothetical protein [Fimbriimonadaceae bacterium]